MIWEVLRILYKTNNILIKLILRFRIKDIFSAFKNRYNFLINYNFKEDESILKYLINPSNNVFSHIKKENII